MKAIHVDSRFSKHIFFPKAAYLVLWKSILKSIMAFVSAIWHYTHIIWWYTKCIRQTHCRNCYVWLQFWYCVMRQNNGRSNSWQIGHLMLFAIDPILHTHTSLITPHNDYLQLSLLLTSFQVVFEKSHNQITVYLLYFS